jgi:hypothetical protein
MVEDTLQKNKENPKFVRFWEYEFPVKNPILFSREQNGEMLDLASFHWPTTVDRSGPDYKGIVFMVHGYADYSWRNAQIAKEFAEKGYDFFSLD